MNLVLRQALSFSFKKKKKFLKKDRFCFGKPTKAWHTKDTDFPAREFVFYCNLLLLSTFCPNLRLTLLKGSSTLPTNEGLPSWLLNSEGKKLFRFHHVQNFFYLDLKNCERLRKPFLPLGYCRIFWYSQMVKLFETLKNTFTNKTFPLESDLQMKNRFVLHFTPTGTKGFRFQNLGKILEVSFRKRRNVENLFLTPTVLHCLGFHKHGRLFKKVAFLLCFRKNFYFTLQVEVFSVSFRWMNIL